MGLRGDEEKRLTPPGPDLRPLLRPRSIAVVGASDSEGSFGRRLLAAVRGWRYEGSVYPVNPRYGSVAGLPCHPSVSAVGEPVDLAVFAISDDRVEAGLAEAVAAGVRAAVIFGRCYEPPVPGAPSKADRLGDLAREGGIPVCGCNCMGFVNSVDGLRVSGNPPPTEDRPGSVGLVSHSGSSWSGMVGNRRQLNFSYAVSAGQEIATTMADYVRFMVADPQTRAIGCIVETVRDPAGFLSALEEAEAAGIPVAALKLGRSERGRRFAAAHTGAISGRDAAFDAVFDRHRVARCETLDELADTLELLASPRRPASGGLGAVTDSGGERQLLVDLAEDVGCELADLRPGTVTTLEGILDRGMTAENPVDTFGDGRILLGECLEAVAADPGVAVAVMDTNLVHGRPRYLTASVEAARRVLAATDKPLVVLCNVQSAVSSEAAATLRDLGVPVMMGTRSGLVALRHLLRRHVEPSAADPVRAIDGDALRRWSARLASRDGGEVEGARALEMLGDFGFPTVRTEVVGGREELAAAALRSGYPLVLKTAEPGILHKTELGGVLTGIQSERELLDAYAALSERCGPRALVQAQVPAGVELLLGMVSDEQFGPLVTVAAGGVLVELSGDSTSFLPPIGPGRALAELGRLRIHAILKGARGQPPADLDALSNLISRFSALCVALGPWVSELEVNPLIVDASDIRAVDAVVVRRADARGRDRARTEG
ncbi:MAG: acetate--CoA ligase family protein [Candidatus Dormibacteraeota bacterium]|uniref:Acetate--CoA ligase family protein n=1 Tax=Candidatus Nephthysia bennettiae TaxID=3127016 RepID=A0A934K4Y5_9BACT|nr:acetate--CoA ligase family protein [Candidatus Dormibacteraeota bacterium]